MAKPTSSAMTAGPPGTRARTLPGALARPEWRAGIPFDAVDLRLEQKYLLQRLRRHRRLVHGWGVVCGLNVAATGAGWELYICPGYGLGPCGDEIDLQCRYRFDLSDYLWTQPVGNQTDRVWIAIEAAEEPDAYVPAPTSGCGCGCTDAPEKPSRLADAYRVAVSWMQPTELTTPFDLCSGITPPCPPCPPTCGLILATVILPSSQSESIKNSAIHHL